MATGGGYASMSEHYNESTLEDRVYITPLCMKNVSSDISRGHFFLFFLCLYFGFSLDSREGGGGSYYFFQEGGYVLRKGREGLSFESQEVNTSCTLLSPFTLLTVSTRFAKEGDLPTCTGRAFNPNLAKGFCR
jgi:hypothetical protein